MCSKTLTFSDTSTSVAKAGRLVLPRAQLHDHLSRFLLLGAGRKMSASALAHGRVAANLVLYDDHGKAWPMVLKSWSNQVRGEIKPTYILENTAAFMQEFGLKEGNTLYICDGGDHIIITAKDFCSHQASPVIKRKSVHSSPQSVVPTKKLKQTSITDEDAALALVSLHSDDYSCSRNSSPATSDTGNHWTKTFAHNGGYHQLDISHQGQSAFDDCQILILRALLLQAWSHQHTI